MRTYRKSNSVLTAVMLWFIFFFVFMKYPHLQPPWENEQFARCLSILMHRSLGALLGQELKGSAVLDLYQE